MWLPGFLKPITKCHVVNYSYKSNLKLDPTQFVSKNGRNFKKTFYILLFRDLYFRMHFETSKDSIHRPITTDLESGGRFYIVNGFGIRIIFTLDKPFLRFERQKRRAESDLKIYSFSTVWLKSHFIKRIRFNRLRGLSNPPNGVRQMFVLDLNVVVLSSCFKHCRTFDRCHQ